MVQLMADSPFHVLSALHSITDVLLEYRHPIIPCRSLFLVKRTFSGTDGSGQPITGDDKTYVIYGRVLRQSRLALGNFIRKRILKRYFIITLCIWCNCTADNDDISNIIRSFIIIIIVVVIMFMLMIIIIIMI